MAFAANWGYGYHDGKVEAFTANWGYGYHAGKVEVQRRAGTMEEAAHILNSGFVGTTVRYL